MFAFYTSSGVLHVKQHKLWQFSGILLIDMWNVKCAC
jgi:hypothetical protein